MPRDFSRTIPQACSAALLVLALGACDAATLAVNDLAAAFRDTTLKPIGRAMGVEDDGKSASSPPMQAKVGDGSTEATQSPTPWTQSRDADLAVQRVRAHLRKQAGNDDAKEALAQLKIFAERGHAPAQNLLGLLYERGQLVDADGQQAAKWYGAAAEQGLAAAQYNLGLMYRTGARVARHDARSYWWLEKAAQQNIAEAQYMVAVMLEDGIGVGRDPQTAVKWYQPAAHSGYAPAQHNLAVAYARGVGVAKDEAAAAKWYGMAAAQGQPMSQLLYGAALAEGSGIARDREQAYLWLLRAATNPASDATLRRTANDRAGKIAGTLTPAQIDRARAAVASSADARN